MTQFFFLAFILPFVVSGTLVTLCSKSKTAWSILSILWILLPPLGFAAMFGAAASSQYGILQLPIACFFITTVILIPVMDEEMRQNVGKPAGKGLGTTVREIFQVLLED